MDRTDTTLRAFFAVQAPAGLGRRLQAALREEPRALEALIDRFHVEASERGIARLRYGHGRDVAAGRGRRYAEQARHELAEYLGGRRTFFTVPVDLAGVGEFQGRVLGEANRIPFARAVGNALGANPVPVIVPCHRVIRGDGSWGHYAFGGALKTRLLELERTTPLLIGCTSTRIVCRRGCANEQRIGEHGRVVFASVADAASVGYRACKVCTP
jgi:O-6-methylguanine DNA methyltransferase